MALPALKPRVSDLKFFDDTAVILEFIKENWGEGPIKRIKDNFCQKEDTHNWQLKNGSNSYWDSLWANYECTHCKKTVEVYLLGNSK